MITITEDEVRAEIAEHTCRPQSKNVSGAAASSPINIQVNLNISDDEWAAFKLKARQDGGSRAARATMLIQQYIHGGEDAAAVATKSRPQNNTTATKLIRMGLELLEARNAGNGG